MRPQFTGSETIIGFFGGVFGGFVGLGGGIVMIPLMVHLMGLPQHMAHGNSLSAIVFTGMSGAITYFLMGSVDVTAALFLAVSAVVTARYGALLARKLTSDNLRKYFGVFNIFVSLMLLLKDHFTHTNIYVHNFALKSVFLLLLGSLTGLTSGLFGVGGGTIMVPGLVMILGASQHLAQGTSLLAMVPACFSGAFSYYRFGHVDLRIALGLSFGALLGGSLGGVIANHLPEFHLRVLFSLVLTVLGIKYIKR
ncbi:MAG: sulfite exporter TauE/SafE family protein [Deltaproteobacteria bacterium]|nr:sulfite exporter TauE/SafE family protein [Deltaproteobacteria bacterium]